MPDLTPYNRLLSIAAPFLVVVWWLLVLWIIAHLCGWSRLAKFHRANHRPDGKTIHWCSLHFAPGMGYGNCLNVVLSREGVYMVPVLLVRFAHPALLIPWQRTGTIQRKRFLFMKWYCLPIYAAGRRFKLILPRSAKEWMEANAA